MAFPNRQPAPIAKEIVKIKSKIDSLIEKMQNKEKFTPTHKELGTIAKDIIKYINKNHDEVVSHQSYLKAAIIDLTEVPDMAPEMQRIAFLTVLKDVSKELELFINCW